MNRWNATQGMKGWSPPSHTNMDSWCRDHGIGMCMAVQTCHVFVNVVSLSLSLSSHSPSSLSLIQFSAYMEEHERVCSNQGPQSCSVDSGRSFQL